MSKNVISLKNYKIPKHVEVSAHSQDDSFLDMIEKFEANASFHLDEGDPTRYRRSPMISKNNYLNEKKESVDSDDSLHISKELADLKNMKFDLESLNFSMQGMYSPIRKNSGHFLETNEVNREYADDLLGKNDRSVLKEKDGHKPVKQRDSRAASSTDVDSSPIDNSSFQKELEKSKSENESMKNFLNQKPKRIEDFENQIKELNSQCQSLVKSRNYYHKLLEEKSALNQSLSILEKKHEESNAKSEQLRKALEEQVNHNEISGKKIVALKAQVHELELQNTKKDNLIKELKEDKEHLSTLLKKRDIYENNLLAQLEESQKIARKTHQENQKLSEKAAHYQSQISNKEDERDDKYLSLLKQLETYKIQCNTLLEKKNMLEMQTENNQDLKKKIRNLEHQNSILHQSNEMLSQRVEHLVKEHNKLTDKYKSHYETAQRRNEELKEELYTSKFQSLEEESLRKQIERLGQQREKLNHDLSLLTKENIQLKSRLSMLARDASESAMMNISHQELTSVQDNFQLWKKKYSRFAAKHKKLLMKYQSVAESNTIYKQRIAEMKDRIAEMKEIQEHLNHKIAILIEKDP